MERLFSAEMFIWFAILVTALAAVIDFRTGHIPNWLTVGSLAAGAALRLVGATWFWGLDGLRAAGLFVVLGVLLCSAVPLLLWRIAGLGGGDLKLLAAVGAICGPFLGFRAQIYSFITIALYAAGRLAYGGHLFRALASSLSLILRPVTPKKWRRATHPELIKPLRFGPAVLAGTSLAVFFSRQA